MHKKNYAIIQTSATCFATSPPCLTQDYMARKNVIQLHDYFYRYDFQQHWSKKLHFIPIIKDADQILFSLRVKEN